MMTNSKIFTLIIRAVKNAKLKSLIEKQFKHDEWGSSISEIESLINNNTLNRFDQNAATVFLCRDYSLKYRHGDCLKIINHIDDVEITLNKEDHRHLALLGFTYHTFAISLGYMGKKRDDRYKDFLGKASKIYDQLAALGDKADLVIQSIDLDYYYDEALGIPELLNKYDSIPTDLHDEKDISFRLGIISLMGYFKVGKENLLKSSINYLQSYLEKSNANHYKSYWASCALMVSQRAIGENYTKLPTKTPDGAISKAERFPLILFLLSERYELTASIKRPLDIF